jgi:RNA-directed DNA polymerase
MKRHGNLWEKIVSMDNLLLAHKQAKRGKSFYTEVKMVESNPEFYLGAIQKSLLEKSFTTSNYEIEDRFDGRKMRTIYKLPYFPDRIVQHALMNVVGPIFVNGLIRDTFQSIPGRGTSDAARRIKTLIRSENPPKFALKVDVHKYYPSVDNAILKLKVREKIKCPDTLWLIEDIIDSIPGLPIGNYTSQHLGNVYLSRIDWWIKQEIRPRGYYRYCDDIVILTDSTQELIQIKDELISKLSELKLKIKPDWNIYNVQKQGVDFVGFVFRPDQTRLRKSIAHNMRAALRRINNSKGLTPNDLSSIMSYQGWVKQCNAKRLWRHNLTDKLINNFPNQLRGKV